MKALEELATFFIGTTAEIKEKMDTVSYLMIHFAEAAAIGWSIGEISHGRINPYTTPFAIDGVFRFRNYLRQIRDHYQYEKECTLASSGVIGTLRERRLNCGSHLNYL